MIRAITNDKSSYISYSFICQQILINLFLIKPSFTFATYWLIKLMISTNIPLPQLNFWQELQIKVQQIQRRTGEQAPPPIPREQSIRKKRFSRFEVQQAWHRSIEEAQTLANRIKYLQIQQNRHNRTLQLAKQKYERMMAVRQRSLKEKDDCRKKISELNEEISKQVGQKVSKAREERFRVTQSVQRVRQRNQSEAKEIRDLSSQFEKAMKEQREMQVQQKRYKVQSARQSVEKSRMRLSQLQEDRVRLGKVQHKETIRKQLTLNLHQHRRNSLLRQKLEQSIIQAQNNKQQTLTLLQEYQSMMVPTPRSRNTSQSRSRGGVYARPISLTLTT